MKQVTSSFGLRTKISKQKQMYIMKNSAFAFLCPHWFVLKNTGWVKKYILECECKYVIEYMQDQDLVISVF